MGWDEGPWQNCQSWIQNCQRWDWIFQEIVFLMMSATTCPHPHSNTLHTLRLTQALLDDFGRAFLEQVTNPVPAFVLVCMVFFDIVEDMIGNHGWHSEQVFSSKSMKLFIYLSTIKCSIQIQHYQLTTKEYTYVYDR